MSFFVKVWKLLQEKIITFKLLKNLLLEVASVMVSYLKVKYLIRIQILSLNFT